MKVKRCSVGAQDGINRIEKWLAKRFAFLPRPVIFKTLRQKDVKVNGVATRIGARVAPGDQICIYLPDAYEGCLNAQKTPAFMQVRGALDIVFADENIMVINKPAGICCQPRDDQLDCIQNRLLKYLFDQHSWNPTSSFIPSIVQRLDTNTTGLMLAAKNAPALAELNSIIKNRLVAKYYWCLTKNPPDPPAGTLKHFIYKPQNQNTVQVSDWRKTPQYLTAICHYQTHKTLPYNQKTLVEVQLETGRTHQIRAQFAYMGWPLVGDRKYAASHEHDKTIVHQALCAYRLVFSALDAKTYPTLAYLAHQTFVCKALPPWLIGANL